MEQRRRLLVDATRTYTVILEPDIEGGFVVHVPALPEVCTQGDSEQEALDNAREAIELAIGYRLAEGEIVPSEYKGRVREITVNIVTSIA